MKVGIQGFEGSFHHQAATEFFNQDIDIAPFENFRQVFEALETGLIDRAVVAIENSLYGSINDTYDLLTQHKPWIMGEIYLHIRLDLLAIPGATIDDITDIYSQSPALAESKLFLREHLPIATQHEYADTALSARFVARRNQRSIAAIASQAAGKLHGLIPIEESIEDHKHNYTRFVVLSKTQSTMTDEDKTSIVLHANHRPGSLYEAIGAFAENSINLSKIESRPFVDDTSWRYQFYVDFEAGLNNESTKKALETLKRFGDEFTILGSYKGAKLPNGIR